MKKILVASILGLMAVGSSYGQGSVAFNNYDPTTYAPVTYANVNVPAGKAGLSLGNTFKAGLMYQIGSGQWTLASIVATFGGAEGSINGKFFDAGTATIPLYTSGPISFQVLAYNGADFASSTIRGQSAIFTLPSIATGLSAVEGFGPGLTAFTVALATPIPEPTTMALAGLGALSLLMFRRKQ